MSEGGAKCGTWGKRRKNGESPQGLMQPVAKGFNFQWITLPTTMWLYQPVFSLGILDPDQHRLKITATPERHHNHSMIRFILNIFSCSNLFFIYLPAVDYQLGICSKLPHLLGLCFRDDTISPISFPFQDTIPPRQPSHHFPPPSQHA